MKAQRAWQIGLTAGFALGALQRVHMLVDFDTTMRFRIELHGLVDGEAIAGGFWSILPMFTAGAITVALGILLVWRGLHLPAARALIAFLLFWNKPLFWLWLSGFVNAERVFHLAFIADVGSMIPLVLFAMWFPRRLTGDDLAAAHLPKRHGRLRSLLSRPWHWLRNGLLRPRFLIVASLVALVPAFLDSDVGMLVWLVAMCLAVSYLRTGYLVADEEGRRRSIWILNGFSLGLWILVVGVAVVGLGVTTVVAGDLQGGEGVADAVWIAALEIIYAAAWLAILGSLVAATLYRGALDPGLVLRKTTVYGALGVIAAFLFAALENVFSAHVAVWLGFPGSSGGWIAGGLVALTVGPLRSRLERRTDRVIDRLLPPTELARGERRQSVVVFSDLSGYTRLSTKDPDAALTSASLLHKVAQRTANRFRGRVVKTLGDGVLMEFARAESAVLATDFVAESFATAAEVLELPPLEVTSGVHVGEVVDGRDGDIFGEAVNLAAKIEAAAAPGEVWVSRAVADQFAEDPAAKGLVRVGSVELPGVPVVECFRVRAEEMAP